MPLETPRRINPLAQPQGRPENLGGRKLVWRFDGGVITFEDYRRADQIPRRKS